MEAVQVVLRIWRAATVSAVEVPSQPPIAYTPLLRWWPFTFLAPGENVGGAKAIPPNRAPKTTTTARYAEATATLAWPCVVCDFVKGITNTGTLLRRVKARVRPVPFQSRLLDTFSTPAIASFFWRLPLVKRSFTLSRSHTCGDWRRGRR